ncbi:hypothetical protein [Paraburkholderia sp. JPY419]|uniref:hypothetical protein n=1 Tax=Paraburkholderia sp. JPY419 TaxID=667660 RepID=UPI003D2207D2
MNQTGETNRSGNVMRHAFMMHEIPRLHTVLHLIHDIADGPGRPDALAEIARLARCALVVSVPPDPRIVERDDACRNTLNP